MNAMLARRPLLSAICVYVCTIIFSLCTVEMMKSQYQRAFDPEAVDATLSTEFNSKSLKQMGANPDDPIRMFHMDHSLCHKRPTDFNLPKKQKEDIAILLSEGPECPMEQVVNNIIKWYQAENSKVKYLILHTDDSLPKRKVNMFKTSNMDEIPLVIFYTTDRNAKEYLKSFEGLTSNDSLMIYFKKKAFTDQTATEQATALVLDFMTSSMITIVSLLVTLKILEKLLGGSFAIEISWRTGVDIMYLSNEVTPPDPKQLFTKEQVLELPETKYDPDITDEELCIAVNSTCSICLDDFEKGEQLCVLPCGHLHHTECIMPWLTTRNANCPLCKESFWKEVDKKDS